ncbi:hypothetical protein BUY81_12500, partial [Staphylococcus equorum]|uniref:hypothetical protein n=1 Tax=Staphylococcus equorum TaxID=246432 RepID=UPI000D4983CD
FNIVAFVLFLLLGNFILEILVAAYTLLTLTPMLIIIVYRVLYNNQILFTTFLTTKNTIPHYKQFIISAILTVLVQIVALQFFERSLLILILPLLVIQLVHNNWYWVLYVIKDIRSDKRDKEIINE